MNYSDRAQQERIFAAFAGPMVTGILGPRRVGKSTLIDHYFSLNPDETVVNLNMDSMHEREKIKAGLLEDLILNAIRRHLTPGQRVWVAIDEAQKCPELFEQIKLLYDANKNQNAIKFILTGSALLELHRLSAESLAGRIQLYYLSAFNLSEVIHLKHQIKREHTVFDIIQQNRWDESAWGAYQQQMRPYATLCATTLDEMLLWGGLPEALISTSNNERLDYLGNYLQTYLEKDVRAIESITDLNLYRHLMDIMAEQTGSVRDDQKILQALACHRETLNKYRGYLQATLMYQEVYPYINSSLKRLVKSPKGYLINNGLISFLSGLDDTITLTKTGHIGHRLENWFLNELHVWLNKQPGRHDIHYWRTSAGVEVDFIVHRPPYIFPFEVTMSKTIDAKKVKHLLQFREYEPKAEIVYYIYQGELRWDAKHKIVFIPAWLI
ncbi:MAG: ATP-binding protein [Gammaproteobacteria bacterium]|nr:ATP-binding protein [Gammaproteobacteria bacterium]